IVLSGVGVLAGAGFGTAYFFMFNTVRSSFSPNPGAAMAWVGTEAPHFSVTTLGGQLLELSALRGRRVVVDFWARWCGPCIHEVPDFHRLSRENSRDELLVIAIGKESRDVIEPF